MLGHHVITLSESLNADCANIGSRFYGDKEGLYCCLSEDCNVFFSYLNFLLLAETNLNKNLANPACF